MKISIPKICWLFLMTWFVSTATIQNTQAQVVLYLELMKEIKPIKYYEGQTLSFKSNGYEEDWQNVKITRIIDEEKIILYEGGMVKLEDITHIRRVRGWANVTGVMLQTFGVAWFGIGGLATLTTDFDPGWDTLIIGATAIGTGWLIRKLFKFKKYKVSKKVRLKIMDLSWPDPVGTN